MKKASHGRKNRDKEYNWKMITQMPMGENGKVDEPLYGTGTDRNEVGATTAFAAGDPLSVINNLSHLYFSLIRAIGLILLGFGVVQVGLSLKAMIKPEGQMVLTLAGGVMITFAKESSI